jgi:hypothetical protein
VSDGHLFLQTLKVCLAMVDLISSQPLFVAISQVVELATTKGL